MTVRKAIETYLVGKKTDDFLFLSPHERHFLFSMRSYYLDGRLRCLSEKQQKYFFHLIQKVKDDGGVTAKVEKSLVVAEKRIKDGIRKLIKQESEILHEETGISRKALKERLGHVFRQ